MSTEIMLWRFLLLSYVNVESGENSNPTIETLKKIADALEVSIEELLK